MVEPGDDLIAMGSEVFCEIRPVFRQVLVHRVYRAAPCILVALIGFQGIPDVKDIAFVVQKSSDKSRVVTGKAFWSL